jgi:hypothetical protein
MFFLQFNCARDQHFFSPDFGMILPVLPSFLHGGYGSFTLSGAQFTGSALAISGSLAAKPVGKGAISCLS